MRNYTMTEKFYQDTFFADGIALEILTHRGDPLRKLDEYVDWTKLAEVVAPIWINAEAKSPCGRKPWPVELMLKIMILQRVYNLSFDEMEYQIFDRLSFRRFLGLCLTDKVPDSRTIWLYADKLAKKDGARKLFDKFKEMLAAQGVEMNSGAIVDASFVTVPIQRNTPDENAQVKAGETPAEWKKHPAKLRQKDVDARWTKKNKQAYYGYKNHVKADRTSKIITDYVVTDASVHDSQALERLAQPGDKTLHADSAYSGTPCGNMLRDKQIEAIICEKGRRNHPLTDEQKASNRKKSSVRCRVEHVFGSMVMSLHGLMTRSIGFCRNEHQCGMLNLCYNILRGMYLCEERKVNDHNMPTTAPFAVA
jgi:IS5 family transposase